MYVKYKVIYMYIYICIEVIYVYRHMIFVIIVLGSQTFTKYLPTFEVLQSNIMWHKKKNFAHFLLR